MVDGSGQLVVVVWSIGGGGGFIGDVDDGNGDGFIGGGGGNGDSRDGSGVSGGVDSNDGDAGNYCVGCGSCVFGDGDGDDSRDLY